MRVVVGMRLSELEEGEVVYCTPPPGYAMHVHDGATELCPYSDGDGISRICQVQKPVYGMAQAGRRWQRALFPWLNTWSGGKFTQSEQDMCVFHCVATTQTPKGPRDERLIAVCVSITYL